MKTKPTIFGPCNPKLTELFARAKYPAKVMCGALDYAKATHTALLCNGSGELLQPSFTVENSAQGVQELLERVRQQSRKHRIAQENIFFGGEDCPCYAENFLRHLRQEGYLVVRINAWEAKQNRTHWVASNDTLDLSGVGKSCLSRRGQTVEDWPPAYANLRLATRGRAQLVSQRTAISNRIHTYVERLLPGFLDSKKSGLSPFRPASLDLMSQHFSPREIRQRGRGALVEWLRHRDVEDPEAAADALKALAKSALEPVPAQTAMLPQSLAALVQVYRGLSRSIEQDDQQLAYWLARTPGAFLTSITGVAPTLASLWVSELGPVEQWGPVRCLCSYAGVVARSKQTGGPNKEAVVASPQRHCNTRLKNALLQVVEKVQFWDKGALSQEAQRLGKQGSHVQFAMAKRLLRLGKCLLRTQAVYRPKALLAPQTPKSTLAQYYQNLWPKLLKKWKDAGADLADVFSPEQPLGQWRQMAKQLYALELRLPPVRPARKPARTLQSRGRHRRLE